LVTVAGLFQVLVVLAEILGLVEWVILVVHSTFVLEPQPVALFAASGLRAVGFLPFLKSLEIPVLVLRGLRCYRRSH
jgi:hypothetical protein